MCLTIKHLQADIRLFRASGKTSGRKPEKPSFFGIWDSGKTSTVKWNHYLEPHFYTKFVLVIASNCCCEKEIRVYESITSHKPFSIKFNLLSANPTKWSNTLKQFVGKLRLALKGLSKISGPVLLLKLKKDSTAGPSQYLWSTGKYGEKYLGLNIL